MKNKSYIANVCAIIACILFSVSCAENKTDFPPPGTENYITDTVSESAPLLTEEDAAWPEASSMPETEADTDITKINSLSAVDETYDETSADTSDAGIIYIPETTSTIADTGTFEAETSSCQSSSPVQETEQDESESISIVFVTEPESLPETTPETTESAMPMQPETPAPASLTKLNGQDIAYEAMSHLGLPYVSGGRSFDEGVDCSNFTSLVYEKFGVRLSGAPAGQLASGMEISLSDAKPGDLVVCLYGPESTYAGHCGIIIGQAPNGQIITVSAHPDISAGMNACVAIHQINGYYGAGWHVRRVIDNTYPRSLTDAWEESVSRLSKCGNPYATSDWRYYDDLSKVTFSGNVFGYNTGGYTLEIPSEKIGGALRTFMNTVDEKTDRGCRCIFSGYYLPTGKTDADGYEILEFITVFPAEETVIKNKKSEDVSSSEEYKNWVKELKEKYSPQMIEPQIMIQAL